LGDCRALSFYNCYADLLLGSSVIEGLAPVFVKPLCQPVQPFFNHLRFTLRKATIAVELAVLGLNRG